MSIWRICTDYKPNNFILCYQAIYNKNLSGANQGLRDTGVLDHTPVTRGLTCTREWASKLCALWVAFSSPVLFLSSYGTDNHEIWWREAYGKMIWCSGTLSQFHSFSLELSILKLLQLARLKTSNTPYLAIDERAPGKEASTCLSLCIMQWNIVFISCGLCVFFVNNEVRFSCSNLLMIARLYLNRHA